MSLGQDLKKRAVALSQQALEKILADEKRAARVTEAIGAVQRGKQAVERGQDRLMHAFRVATKSDFKAVGKRLSALKRQLRDLDEKLSKVR